MLSPRTLSVANDEHGRGLTQNMVNAVPKDYALSHKGASGSASEGGHTGGGGGEGGGSPSAPFRITKTDLVDAAKVCACAVLPSFFAGPALRWSGVK